MELRASELFGHPRDGLDISAVGLSVASISAPPPCSWFGGEHSLGLRGKDLVGHSAHKIFARWMKKQCMQGTGRWLSEPEISAVTLLVAGAGRSLELVFQSAALYRS